MTDECAALDCDALGIAVTLVGDQNDFTALKELIMQDINETTRRPSRAPTAPPMPIIILDDEGTEAYRYSDQYARLEAVRVYLAAAARIVTEANTYEVRNVNMDDDLDVKLEQLLNYVKFALEEAQEGVDRVAVPAAAEHHQRSA